MSPCTVVWANVCVHEDFPSIEEADKDIRRLYPDVYYTSTTVGLFVVRLAFENRDKSFDDDNAVAMLIQSPCHE